MQVENQGKLRFKDTKAGKILLKKLPKAVDIVGDMLPESGVLGIVKNIIDTEPNLSVEEKNQLHSNVIDAYVIEAQDRDSARRREVEIARSGKKDYMFLATGAVGLASFLFIVYSIAFIHVPQENKEIWIHLIGVVEGFVGSIFVYYFGGKLINDKK